MDIYTDQDDGENVFVVENCDLQARVEDNKAMISFRVREDIDDVINQLVYYVTTNTNDPNNTHVDQDGKEWVSYDPAELVIKLPLLEILEEEFRCNMEVEQAGL